MTLSWFGVLGDDPRVDKMLSANKSSKRTAISVQKILGLKKDDNPHQWYSPSDVLKVADHITADYKKMDSANAATYDQRKADSSPSV